MVVYVEMVLFIIVTDEDEPATVEALKEKVHR